MSSTTRVPFALFFLRLSVFLVMLIWTLDKFVNPDHAKAVYEHFYFLGGLGQSVMYILGGIELLLLLAFVAGVMKRFTYGAVLLFHTVSTLSSFKQYLSPYDGANILFFAAWPMLAACVALYLLRDLDTRWNLGKES